MAKLAVIIRNKKRQELVQRYAAKRAELKAQGDYTALDKLPKNASPVRVRNRCQITGRPRGFMRKFGVARDTFRAWASTGRIPGIEKASW